MMPSRLGLGPQTLDPQTQAVGAWLPGRQPDGPFGRANRASPRRAGGLRAGRRPQLDRVAARRFLCREDPLSRGACASRFSSWFWRGAARALNRTRLGVNLSTNGPVAPLTGPCRASVCSPAEGAREAPRLSRRVTKWPWGGEAQ